MNRFSVGLVLSLLSGIPLLAGQSKSLEELTRESASIVLGRVAAADSYRGDDGEIYTDVSVVSEAVLKQGRAGAELEPLRFTVRGGTIGDIAVIFSDSPRFETGESVLLFTGGGGQPEEKISMGDARAADTLMRVAGLRSDAGEPVNEVELERARRFLHRTEAVDLNAAADCSAYIGPKWGAPGTTYTAASALPAAWLPALQAAAQSWSNAGSRFALSLNAGSPHVIALGDLGAGSTLASTRIEFSRTTGLIARFSMTLNNRVSWSASGEAGRFDLQNIVTHEFGHALGLDHPRALACSEQSMWASAGAGETKKRSLEDGDRYGVTTLYGTAGTPSSNNNPPPVPQPPAPVPPAPSAPVVTNFAVVSARAVAGRPFALLFQGSGFESGAVQGVIKGGPCGTGGCLAQSLASSNVNVVFYFGLPAGSYSMAVRNGSSGALSAAQPFVVNAN